MDSLKRCSLTFIGDDHALSFAVAKVVGSRLGWFPVDLPKVVCGMRKVASVDQLSPEDLGRSQGPLQGGMIPAGRSARGLVVGSRGRETAHGGFRVPAPHVVGVLKANVVLRWYYPN